MEQPRPFAPSHPTARLVGASPAIEALRAQIRHLAPFDTLGNPAVPTLLLQGETGTGKGLVARVVHDSGPRAQGPCIEVNCAAIPETLLEAELFGFEAGTFTDAKRAKPGLFEAASGGTLFLDEIDALPPALQGKFLKAIEDKRVRRLGAMADRAVDVKLIAAAQVDLGVRVGEGRFRADLYHRLAVVLLVVPLLRERGEDILGLARHFLQHYATAHGLRGKRLSQAAEAWLKSYSWPGNVRELSHLMERIMLLSPEDIVAPDTLARLCLPQSPAAVPTAPAPARGPQEPLDEAGQIRQALAHTAGNVVRAARLLGLSRSAMRHRMHRYGIEHSDPTLAPGDSSVADRTSASPAPSEQEASAGVPVASHAMAAPMDHVVPARGWEQKPAAILAIEVTWPEATGLEPLRYEPWTAATHWEQAIGEKVRGFGGILLPRAPALLTAAFGIPQALEQLPQRVVQAALAIRQAVAEGRSTAGEEQAPQVRQAVHWGAVLVDVQANNPTAQVLAAGETLALPVRLLGHAAPGEILVSPQIGRLIGRWFELQVCALPAGTGRPDQLGAYRVVGLLPRRSPLAGLTARPLSRFIGRGQELAALHDLLARVEAGRGQVVGVMGEPGIGKSRLLYEFRSSLAGRQVTYLEGRCLAYGSATPYLPVLDLLRDNCAITETDSPEAVTEKVRMRLAELGMEPDAWGPYLYHLLGLDAGRERLADFSPEAIKTRTFEAFRQMSLQGSRRRPLILAVEDLHWVDQTSEDCLAALAESLAGAPILLLCTYRPGYRPPWIGKSYATQLALRPLAPPDSQQVVQALLQTEQLPEVLAQQIVARAEGNPLFLEELVQALIDQEMLSQGQEEGGQEAVPARPRALAAIQLPTTVQGVLAARIDRLGAGAKGLLHTLAVVGKECSLGLLQTIVEQPEEQLRGRLTQLQAAEFIYEQSTVPEAAYTFKHALTQEVAYSSLPPQRRRQVHERVAQAIEARYAERLEEYSSELAHHYSRSSDTAKAVAYCQRAGQQAVERSAHVEAISHLTQGLELLKSLPDTPERTQYELNLQTTLGPAFAVVRGPAAQEVERTYTRAWELCQQVGETVRLFPVLMGLQRCYSNRAELQQGRAIGEQLLSLAQRLHDPAALWQAHYVLGSILFNLGQLASARDHLEQALALYASQPHRFPTFSDWPGTRVVCVGYAARLLWMLGYPDQALAGSHNALTLAQELAEPYHLASALTFAAIMHQCRREGQAVQERAAALIAVSSAQGFAFRLAQGTILQGWALVAQGQEEGMAQSRQGLTAYRATGAVLWRPYFLALLAESYGRDGQIEEGLTVLAEALAAVRKTGECWWEAELRRLQGELLGQAKKWVEAEECFHQALTIARRQQAKSLELRVAMSLARLWQQPDKRDEARQLLAEIYGWFTEGFDTADLQEARALLHDLS